MVNLIKMLSGIKTDNESLCYEERPEVLAAYRYKLKCIDSSGSFAKKVVDWGEAWMSSMAY